MVRTLATHTVSINEEDPLTHVFKYRPDQRERGEKGLFSPDPGFFWGSGSIFGAPLNKEKKYFKA